MTLEQSYKHVLLPLKVPKGRFCVVIGVAGAIICDQYDMEHQLCRAGFNPHPQEKGVVKKAEKCYDLPILLHNTDQ